MEHLRGVPAGPTAPCDPGLPILPPYFQMRKQNRLPKVTQQREGKPLGCRALCLGVSGGPAHTLGYFSQLFLEARPGPPSPARALPPLRPTPKPLPAPLG